MSKKKGTTRLTDYTQPDAHDDLVIQVCDALEVIVTKLHLRAGMALDAVRSGALGIEPRRAYDYLLGVFHALVGQGQIDEESWCEIDAQLDRLDIAA